MLERHQGRSDPPFGGELSIQRASLPADVFRDQVKRISFHGSLVVRSKVRPSRSVEHSSHKTVRSNLFVDKRLEVTFTTALLPRKQVSVLNCPAAPDAFSDLGVSPIAVWSVAWLARKLASQLVTHISVLVCGVSSSGTKVLLIAGWALLDSLRVTLHGRLSDPPWCCQHLSNTERMRKQ